MEEKNIFEIFKDLNLSIDIIFKYKIREIMWRYRKDKSNDFFLGGYSNFVKEIFKTFTSLNEEEQYRYWDYKDVTTELIYDFEFKDVAKNLQITLLFNGCGCYMSYVELYDQLTKNEQCSFGTLCFEEIFNLQTDDISEFIIKSDKKLIF